MQKKASCTQTTRTLVIVAKEQQITTLRSVSGI